MSLLLLLIQAEEAGEIVVFTSDAPVIALSFRSDSPTLAPSFTSGAPTVES